MPFYYVKFITRTMMRNLPNTLFCFGDNLAQVGYGGQAKEMRGEPNAVGIPTKRKPSRTAPDEFFTDDDYAAVVLIINERFTTVRDHLLNGGDVVWPEDGIGTGLAELEKRAPTIWNHIENIRIFLESMNDD